ncbi:MAG: hypothetical protein ACLGG9_09995 [Thermoleophilia bacterium]
MSTRPIGTPAPVRVIAAPGGAPHAVIIDGRRRRVVAIRDDWRVQDRWWTDQPVDRHYFEVVLEPGRLMVLYREHPSGQWLAHP